MANGNNGISAYKIRFRHLTGNNIALVDTKTQFTSAFIPLFLLKKEASSVTYGVQPCKLWQNVDSGYSEFGAFNCEMGRLLGSSYFTNQIDFKDLELPPGVYGIGNDNNAALIGTAAGTKWSFVYLEKIPA